MVWASMQHCNVTDLTPLCERTYTKMDDWNRRAPAILNGCVPSTSYFAIYWQTYHHHACCEAKWHTKETTNNRIENTLCYLMAATSMNTSTSTAMTQQTHWRSTTTLYNSWTETLVRLLIFIFQKPKMNEQNFFLFFAFDFFIIHMPLLCL